MNGAIQTSLAEPCSTCCSNTSDFMAFVVERGVYLVQKQYNMYYGGFMNSSVTSHKKVASLNHGLTKGDHVCICFNGYSDLLPQSQNMDVWIDWRL